MPCGGAEVACGKGNYAAADSLQILAEVYADQCNFDRAAFYQKLAVVFATEQEAHSFSRRMKIITKWIL